MIELLLVVLIVLLICVLQSLDDIKNLLVSRV